LARTITSAPGVAVSVSAGDTVPNVVTLHSIEEIAGTESELVDPRL